MLFGILCHHYDRKWSEHVVELKFKCTHINLVCRRVKSDKRPYLETFFHWNEESKSSICLINQLFGISDDTLTIRPVNKTFTFMFTLVSIYACKQSLKYDSFWIVLPPLTWFDGHQYPNYPNMLRIGNHLDYLFRLKSLDSPLMASIYHQSREEPTNTLFNIIIR